MKFFFNKKGIRLSDEQISELELISESKNISRNEMEEIEKFIDKRELNKDDQLRLKELIEKSKMEETILDEEEAPEQSNKKRRIKKNFTVTAADRAAEQEKILAMQEEAKKNGQTISSKKRNIKKPHLSKEYFKRTLTIGEDEDQREVPIASGFNSGEMINKMHEKVIKNSQVHPALGPGNKNRRR